MTLIAAVLCPTRPEIRKICRDCLLRSISQQTIILSATIELQRMQMQPVIAVTSRCAGPRRSQAPTAWEWAAASRERERAALSVLQGLVAERAALSERNAALVTPPASPIPSPIPILLRVPVVSQ